MGEPHRHAKREALALAGLGGKGEETTANECRPNEAEQWGEFAYIGEHVRGDDEIKRCHWRALEQRGRVAEDERVIDAALLRLCDHGRGQVDARQMADAGSQRESQRPVPHPMSSAESKGRPGAAALRASLMSAGAR